MLTMLGRGMKGAPSSKRLPEIITLLCYDLIEQRLNDPGAVGRALRQLSLDRSDWPSTFDIIEVLRGMGLQRHGAHKLYLPPPQHKRTAEETATGEAALAQMKKILKGSA